MNSQPETVEGLTPRNVEEPAARCNCCGSGLSMVESLTYGNRCLYCCDSVKNVSFLKFFGHALLDFLIYKKTLAWRNLSETCPDCSEGWTRQRVDEDHVDVSACTSCHGTGSRSIGRIKLLGYLGAVGSQYYEDLTVKQKFELLRSI